ncbi:hypothetical protein EDC65_0437 [Stella humosa]|uniref:Phasin protein n=1 Tax=Stella humosa TaxID=94 RepID=A0A3N1MD97_9PROT|nr:hypothetical protein [Stella humosa]ROQ01259.1 hypothetical protein EDC65_0437 [Stella humosa]BBK31633.1 hypothetical protein STHU_22670 [Stella humosa]
MAKRKIETDARTIGRTMARSQANALQATRLATASATVIGRRMAMGHAAIYNPGSGDSAEFMRMSTEKGTAAIEAASAAMRQSPALAAGIARFAAAEMAAAWDSGMKVAAARSPAGAIQAQMQYAADAMQRAYSFYLGLGAAAASMAGAMTAPVLRTAAANARRLG